MKTYLYRASNLNSTITIPHKFHGGSKFLAPAINRHFCDLFVIIGERAKRVRDPLSLPIEKNV